MRQRERRAERRREATRAPDHHQSQAAGDAEGGFRGHAEAHQAHQGAAVTGDRPQHESNTGKVRNLVREMGYVKHLQMRYLRQHPLSDI